MLNAAGVTQSTEESRGPESRSRQQLPSSSGVLGKSRQSRPLLRSLIRTQHKGSQERKKRGPTKGGLLPAPLGCAGPGTFAGREEQSLDRFLQRDEAMSPLFHLHIVSSPFLSFFAPDYPSQAPRMPPLSSHCVLAAHFGSLSLLGGLPGTSGIAPASLLPSNLAALWKSEGGGTLVAGKAFGSAKPPMGSRSLGSGEREELLFCQVNVQLSWTPEDEGITETLELATLAMPPDSLGAT